MRRPHRITTTVGFLCALAIACGSPITASDDLPQAAPERSVADPERLAEERTIPSFGIDFEVLPEDHVPAIGGGEALRMSDENIGLAAEQAPEVHRTLALCTSRQIKRVPKGAPPDSGRELAHVDIPVWIVSYRGVCLPVMGPVNRIRTPGECAGTQLNSLVNAETGRWLRAFSYR